MKNISTLIYFVNNIQAKFDFDEVSLDRQFEGFLAEMELAEKVPSDRTIKNILDFACSYEVIETKKTGYVEMNLN